MTVATLLALFALVGVCSFVLGTVMLYRQYLNYDSAIASVILQIENEFEAELRSVTVDDLFKTESGRTLVQVLNSENVSEETSEPFLTRETVLVILWLASTSMLFWGALNNSSMWLMYFVAAWISTAVIYDAFERWQFFSLLAFVVGNSLLFEKCELNKKEFRATYTGESHEDLVPILYPRFLVQGICMLAKFFSFPVYRRVLPSVEQIVKANSSRVDRREILPAIASALLFAFWITTVLVVSVRDGLGKWNVALWLTVIGGLVTVLAFRKKIIDGYRIVFAFLGWVAVLLMIVVDILLYIGGRGVLFTVDAIWRLMYVIIGLLLFIAFAPYVALIRVSSFLFQHGVPRRPRG